MYYCLVVAVELLLVLQYLYWYTLYIAHAIVMGFPSVSSLELCSGNSQPSSCATPTPSQRSKETIFPAEENQINRIKGNRQQ